MDDVVLSFDETPNPDARKAVLDREVPPRDVGGPGIRSYAEIGEAEGDPLARAILVIPGVAGVLIGTNWITINRKSGASWAPIQRSVRERVGEVLGG